MHLLIHRNQVHERFPGTARIALFASAFYVLVLALCRLLPYGRSLTSRSIGETLSNDAFDRALGAIYVIYAEPDAIAIAEIEFGKIAVQMLFAAMLIDALHAAFENRIVTFNCVGVDDPTHIFADAVIDGLMHPIFFPERAVSLPIIADDESFLGTGIPSMRPVKVSSISMISPAPPIGSIPTIRMASRMRWLMNHAVFRVTPRVR
jgi:hypothetical protein